MKKKLFLLVLLYCGLHLLDSCCGNDKPYFDFNKLFLQNEILSDTSGTKTVIISVALDSVEYFTSILSFHCTDQLYGTSCPEWGRDGLKNPIVDVEITADQEFKTDFPAGASLKPLFQWNFADTAFHLFPLDKLYFNFEYSEHIPIRLRTHERPDTIGLPFRFNITLLREDGKTVSNTSLPITWQ